MNQQFEEDRAELEAHFQARVQAYIELGETPEQAVRSARQKFGEMQTTLEELKRQRYRQSLLRKPLGILGICIHWLILWFGLVIALFSPLIINDSTSIDGDEGWAILKIIAGIGIVSGTLFGALLSLTKQGKAVREIPLLHAIVLGILSSAVFPIMAQKFNQTLWICPIAGVVSAVLVLLARRAEQHCTKRLGNNKNRFAAFLNNSFRYALATTNKVLKRG